MTKLDDLFDLLEFQDAIEARHVREHHHPTLPLRIVKYTEDASYGRLWNPVTRACRGLVYDTTTNEVVARPFAKFFNHTERFAYTGDHAEQVVVTDKRDGSLGISYPTPDGIAIATPSSFKSEQALHATAVFRDRYRSVRIPDGYTALFEIHYPTNRVVVDYGPLDDLVLLSVVTIETGATMNPTDAAAFLQWPGPVVETFAYDTLADALAAPVRENREGMVVHFVDADERVKIKQADYEVMHRVVTNCTARLLWEMTAVADCHSRGVEPRSMSKHLHIDENQIGAFIAVHDTWRDSLRVGWAEFEAWADRLITEMQNQVDALDDDVARACDTYAHYTSRRDMVEASAREMPGRDAVRFAMLQATEGREHRSALWMAVRPKGHSAKFTASAA